MTRKEAKSCIGTIEMLQRLAYNIHGVMDVIDADNYEKETEYRKEYSWMAEKYINVPYEVDRLYPEKYELLWEITYQDGHIERHWEDCTRFEYDNARTELGDIK